ncbi:GIY-YIG nuclease family protein [Neobacillus niacini]|uniref:GIY-YIG nuclease family protein n=1 Tax=Neobacillus niacini TaxID=86668 RepID=UPI0021CB296E|nr:GIY-YIG nuclease family protein [Neobacillus niacini]MCM3764866.1 GIY-YIG nuclease family protein [Neobacillus niacini]
MDLKEKVKILPTSPGVYLMKDRHHTIIYVGKAKNLKKRVQSYFYQSKGHSPKIKKLINTIHDIDTINTDTEFEAFMLECQLIKEIKPYFNRKMKNPKSYTYITVMMDNGMRRLALTDTPIDGTLHFGPFVNKYTVEKAIQGIKDIFKINCCKSSNKKTPCLNYAIGLCIGVCLGGPALDEYNRIMDRIIAIFDGTDTSIFEEIEQKMQTAAQQYDFKTAAKIRDNLEVLNFLLYKERVIEFTEANQNIAVIEDLDETAFKFFLIKGNKVLFSKKYRREQDNFSEMAAQIAHCFKQNEPHLLVTRDDLDEAQIIYSYLKSSQCRSIIIPEDQLGQSNVINGLL